MHLDNTDVKVINIERLEVPNLGRRTGQTSVEQCRTVTVQLL
jgi:hypothetical protein